MKRAKALMTGLLVAASVVACDKDSVGANVEGIGRSRGARAIVPIEPIRIILHASPTPLLQQSGRLDNLVPPADAEALHTAAPEPKTIRWYNPGHSLGQQGLVGMSG